MYIVNDIKTYLPLPNQFPMIATIVGHPVDCNNPIIYYMHCYMYLHVSTDIIALNA